MGELTALPQSSSWGPISEKKTGEEGKEKRAEEGQMEEKES